MLHVITSLEDKLCSCLNDDPVRPNISLEQRINKYSEAILLLDSCTLAPTAAVCVKYLHKIPSSTQELLSPPKTNSVAVFYSIWSYSKGSGSILLNQSKLHIANFRPYVKTFVTFSPKSEEVKKFHIKNGAKVYRENKDSINYMY